jgi:acyl-CoA thioesterase FadM
MLNKIKMTGKKYIVTGEDVNDFMVMEGTAYVSYTLRLLYHFLFANGFSKEKLNALHLGLQERNHVLICYKNLMFTEHFFVEMQHCYIDDKITIKSCFFNSKNECCAEVTKEIEWFDHSRRQVIAAPKHIVQHFNQNTSA